MLIKIRPFPILGFEFQVSMSKLILPAFVFFSLASSSTFAQATLVKDINSKADSSFSSYPEFITGLNGTVVYAADDALTGRELWRSDGTKAGTSILKDINPTGDSNPGNPDTFSDNTPSSLEEHFVVLDTKALFVANDGTHGYELWVTDGTANGTLMLKDIYPGIPGSEPTELTKVDDLVFFAASNGFSGRELWRTDGTTAGTFIIRDIFSGESGSNPRELTTIGDKLVFTANDGFLGFEPWISDATGFGTKLITDVVDGEIGSSAADFVGVSGDFYFRVGSVIWKSDGTIGGTTSFHGNSELEITYFPQAYFNGKLYFTEYDPSVGVQAVLKTDGTVVGTSYVYFLPFSPDVTYYYNWVRVVENELYLAVSYEDRTQINSNPDLPLIAGVNIKKLNQATELFEDFLLNEGQIYNPGPGYSSPEAFEFIKDGSSHYLVNSLGGGGSILKKAAGSGVTLYESIANFTVEASRSIVASNNKYFFRGHTGTGIDDYELWVSSGTFISSHVIKNSFAPDSSDPMNFIVFNNNVYFQARDGGVVNLWKSDGTAAGTTKIRPDIILENRKMVEFNNMLYFIRLNGADTELWKTDGTNANTVLVKQIFVMEIVRTTTTLFILAFDVTNGFMLWKTDGTTIGTVLVKDINPGPDTSFPTHFTSFNGKLYFKADNGTAGKELWQSDGTAAGTVLLKDINPGAASSNPGDGEGFVENDGKLYFSANNGTEGTELWRTDGTPAGTQRFLDVINGPMSSLPSVQASVGGRLIFRAFGAAGDPVAKLWSTDGTSTQLLLYSKYVNDLKTEDNITGYFSSENDLWKTNGTMAGTTKVADFPALPYTDVVIGVINNKPYMSLDDNVHGVELWKSDGTQAGTFIVQDIYGGTKSSFPSSVIRLQNKVLFVAQNGTTGKELWRHDLVTSLALLNAATVLDVDDELIFPLTNTGESSPIVLTIKNEGELPLDFLAGAITIEGANASSFKTSTFSTTQLTEDASAALTVTFEPQDEGPLTATLKIQSNDPVHPSFTITLRGEGNIVIGVDDPNDPTVVVYPNPSNGSFHIKSAAPVSEIGMIDAAGKAIHVNVSDYSDGDMLIRVDPQPGIYILQMKIHDVAVRKKVVILK